MHAIAHLVTGFLIGLAIPVGHYGPQRVFEASLLAFASVLVDYDAAMEAQFGCFDVPMVRCALTHGGLTHTLAFTLTASLAVWGARVTAYRAYRIQESALSLPVVAGTICFHLLLDVVTYNPPCENTHLYLWPSFRLAFHVNCLFPMGDHASYWLRTVTEWGIYQPLMWVLFYRQVRTPVSARALAGDLMVIALCYALASDLLLLIWMAYVAVDQQQRDKSAPRTRHVEL